jgi:hypothetical protein
MILADPKGGKNDMKRREFVKSAALSAAALGAGNVAKGAVGRAAASATAPEAIKAVLLHLGHNMWCDWFPEGMDLSKFEKGLPDTTLRCKDDLWRKVTDHAAAKGMNMTSGRVSFTPATLSLPSPGHGAWKSSVPNSIGCGAWGLSRFRS